MKKILLILLLLATGISVGHAQNANRSGVFVELAGGIPIGDVLKGDHLYSSSGYEYINAEDVYFKGGFDLNLSVGYRYALSTSWALGLQAGVEGNLSALGNTFCAPKAMLSGRWISSDFSNGMSFYIQPEAGFAMSTSCTENLWIPVGVDLGLNFTNHFYGGLDLAYCIGTDSYIGIEKNVYSGSKHAGYVYMNSHSHMSAKIKLGYRF